MTYRVNGWYYCTPWKLASSEVWRGQIVAMEGTMAVVKFGFWDYKALPLDYVAAAASAPNFLYRFLFWLSRVI